MPSSGARGGLATVPARYAAQPASRTGFVACRCTFSGFRFVLCDRSVVPGLLPYGRGAAAVTPALGQRQGLAPVDFVRTQCRGKARNTLYRKD